MTICILVRHGETTFNVEGRINGDPEIRVPLSARGREEAAQLARHIAHVRIDVCVHTRFPRTLETAQIGLGARAGQVPLVCEALLDDINAGERTQMRGKWAIPYALCKVEMHYSGARGAQTGVTSDDLRLLHTTLLNMCARDP